MTASPALVASETMYFMPGTPLMARSMVIRDDCTSTSALEPGYAKEMMTRGGAISGNWAMGKDFIPNIPMNRNSSDNTIASLTGNLLTGVSKGNVQIRAYNSGDQNYTAAEIFVSVEIYSTHKDILYLFTPNNDGFNDYWELPDLPSWGKCNVKVYNRWGNRVYQSSDYKNNWDGKGTDNFLGKDLPTGTYFCTCKQIEISTGKITSKGVKSITLRR